MSRRWLKIIAASLKCLGAFRRAILLSAVLMLAACGSASPPAGIPSPVSSLMTATNPDTEGNVTLNGAPGAVLPNAVVTAANSSQGASALQWGGARSFLKKILLPSAIAQTDSLVAQVVAGPDGSFALVLQGQVGETLSVTQTVEGQKSPPAVLTIKGTVVDLGVAGRGVAVDDTTSTAFVTGGNGADGLVFDLDLNASEPLPSLPDPFRSFSGLSDLGPITVDEEARNALALSTAQNSLVVFPLELGGEGPFFQSVAFGAPLAIDADSDFSLAAVGVESAIASVSMHDSIDGSFECSFLITTPLVNGSHVRTPFVRLAPNAKGELQVIALSQFSDGNWVLSRNALPSCLTAPVPGGTLVLPPGTEPGGLAIFDQTSRAIVSNTAGAQILVGDFKAGEFTHIPAGTKPKGVTVEENNGRAFIVNSGDNSITLLDLTSLGTRKLVGVGLEPSQLAVDSNLKRGLLLSDLDMTVVIVDLNIE